MFKLAATLGWAAGEVIQRIVTFHRRRCDAVPDAGRYPEIHEEREILLERYRGMAEGGMSAETIALAESTWFWRDYSLPAEERKSFYRLATEKKLRERCRIVYLPHSDKGPLHTKNVDDPLDTWKPQPPTKDPGPWPHSPLFYDGVGSGLHLDDIPPEIFPVDGIAIASRRATTIEEATEFLSRYIYFWGGGNLLVHDEKGNSMAFDKASRCRLAMRKPLANGVNFINGMGAFDPGIAAFIDGQRAQYLRETGQDDQSVEAAYWRLCKGVDRNMARYMNELARKPTLENLRAIMDKRDPDGPMCKSGVPCHPDQRPVEATLQQRLYFLDKKLMWVRQWRATTPVWEDPWEVVQYT